MEQKTGLSAAQLQNRHLVGAPEPFADPAAAEQQPVNAQATSSAPLDTDSPISFPSLAPSATAGKAPVTSGWGGGPRIKPTVAKQNIVSDSFDVVDVHVPSTEDGKPNSLGAIVKSVMAKYKVKIEASTNRTTRQTTFHIKAETEKELERGKRMLLTAVSPVTTQVVQAPSSAIPSIIGKAGATLKQIRESTGVKVDIPKRDPVTSNGHANGADHLDDDPENEVLIPITITGPQSMVYEAISILNGIIAQKATKTVQRVRDIPAHVLPFVLVRRAVFLQAAGTEILLKLNAPEREITVTGDREAVSKAIEAIKGTVEAFKVALVSLPIPLPKRQHRLLSGKAADEILAASKCAVIIPSPDDLSEEVQIWGKGDDLGAGVTAVMQKANSQYIHEFPLPGGFAVARQMLTYMTRTNFIKNLSTNNPGAYVYAPSAYAEDKGKGLNLDIVGEKPAVDAIVKSISELIGKLYGGTREVSIDWLSHKIINGKNAKKIKQYHDSHNVNVFFPPETAEFSKVLLVYDPLSPNASPSPLDKTKNISEVEKELAAMSKEAADVQSVVIPVDAKWHEAIVGKNGTTLNAIIGEEKALSIKVGADAGDASDVNKILIRGIGSDVKRAVQEINSIVDKASNDAIVSSYSTEFDIDREYIARVVGAQGAGVNKLREQLGVKVDVSDDHDDSKDKDSKKKKVSTHSKSNIKITGRQENVEEAKRRILAQVDRLADETSEILKIPNQYHPSLIGQSGKYAIRLEEKYGVKITFPRSSPESGDKTREPLKSDEVLVKGGKKGVASAKAELLEAAEFEKESNNVVKFTVPTRAVPRIVGRGGASINEIKDDTATQIDLDKGDNETNVTIKGTKKAIAAAKAAILEIANNVPEENTVTIDIDNKLHRTIIGAGGQGLKALVEKAGGPTDPRAQAQLLRFPRPGEPSDEVRIRGEPALVVRLKAELDKLVTELKDRIVLAVEVPAVQHRALIGRGGQHLTDLQKKTGALVQFPGSRSYDQVGEAENASEFAAADPANIVKVSGSQAACRKAIEALKAQIKAPAPEVNEISAKVSVPLKVYSSVTHQGTLLRAIRSFGVNVDQSGQPKKKSAPSKPAGVPVARIDDAEEAPAGVQWSISKNYQDAEEGASEWTLRAKDQASLDKAQQRIQDAIASAEGQTHVGYLTFPDTSVFSRLVGTKGATVSRLRAETGAEITIGTEDPTVLIAGSEAVVNAAKEAILKVANTPSRSRREY